MKFLAEEHPASVEISTIHYLLDDLKYTISREECESHVTYLCDKSLARKDTRKMGDKSIVMIIITPDGLDLLDGFRKDIGIEVPKG